MQRFALLLLPVVLLAAACNSDGGSKTSTSTKTATSRPTVARTMAPTATTIVLTTTLQDLNETPEASAGGDPFSVLFGDASPFSLLDSAGQTQTQPADPQLKAELLRASDLPSGFSQMEEFGTTVPTQFGSAQMAANIFSNGDPSSMTGTMVMSASIAMPPGAMNEFARLGGFDKLHELSAADLEQMQSATAALGVSMTDVQVLDASGLGDGGFGMHLVMDFSGLAEAFGAPSSGPDAVPTGIAMDIYIFQRGDHLLMTMVVSSPDQSSGVDGRSLADAMDR